MGDPQNPNATSFLLPPGCRFYPSDEQLICYYLTHKNNAADRRFGFHDVIKEIELYSYDPFGLPDTACFRFGRGGGKRHWYCYATAASRVLQERRIRSAGGGFWKRSGRVRDVLAAGPAKVVVGTRRTFVFYLGDSPKTAVRTDWVMYEYALIGHRVTSFVLCRVFDKSRCGNNTSEPALSSCAEESVATVRHIGVQHDGTISSAIGEAEMHNGSVDHKNEMRLPLPLVNEPDDRVTSGPVAEQMRSSGHINDAMMVNAFTAQQLIAILDEDFIELDDLV